MNKRKVLAPLAAASALAFSLAAVAATPPENPFSMAVVHNDSLNTPGNVKVSEGSCTSGAMIKAHGGHCGARYMKEHHIHKKMSTSSS